LANGAKLSGFTLTKGTIGVFCESSSAGVFNCVLSDNSPNGGAYGGTLDHCTLLGNICWSGHGGGARYSTLNNCTLITNSVRLACCSGNGEGFGGGAFGSTLNNCTLIGNRAQGWGPIDGTGFGGGVADCNLNNCTLIGNEADSGGGAASSTLNNSTITGNSWAGVSVCALNNCIIFNNAGDVDNPARLVGNNWFGDPLFANYAEGNLRLQSNSPCINAGNNAFAPVSLDLDGNPRIAGGTVDIGAYEFQAPVSKISYAWLQRYGLPIYAFTDAADPDGDGVDNYHEWLAHSDPSNPFSFPPRLTLIPYGSNIILTWPTNAVGFTVQSATNLGSTAAWVTNSPAPVVIGGQNVVINPLSGPQQFYRLVH
jgi:hypothetical protein